ncbi:hypothetical protein CJ419_09620 [Vibrio navarrensis]|nr:hypothetical protein [Vibrio navarrensis]
MQKVARTDWADICVDDMDAEMLINHRLSKLDKMTEALCIYPDWLKEQGLTVRPSNITIQR